ncbi:MAG: PilZ domain-containing protein [Desulfocapsaceae bacterium]|jgi:hypothetical protein|nr:PilZ domain-containing protein [Desulfocapsaceae bacterium]
MEAVEKTDGHQERRKIARRHLVFYLRVFDGMSSRVLGHLVDISTRGAMLVCDGPIELNQEFRLRMRLPKEIGGRSELVIDARSMWCRPDTNPDFFVAGFQLNALEETYEENIKRLIVDFSIEDTAAAQNRPNPACSLSSVARV